MVMQFAVTIYGMFRVAGLCFLNEKLIRLNTNNTNSTKYQWSQLFSLRGINIYKIPAYKI
jgi:hypothetical protein